MKLKLTYDQFSSLFELYKKVLQLPQREDMMDKLLQTMQVRIYQELYKKAVVKKTKYTIQLKEESAMAFWVFWSDHTLTPGSYEGNLINQLLSTIHQRFS